MKTGIFTMKRVLAFTIAVVASMTMLAGGTQPVMTAQNASAESQAIKNNKKKISSAKDKISELEQKQADLDKQINSTKDDISKDCLLYTSPSPRDGPLSRMPSSA